MYVSWSKLLEFGLEFKGSKSDEWIHEYLRIPIFGVWQAKPETVQKVCEIVKKQLALSDETELTPESKFAALGADSLDTV